MTTVTKHKQLIAREFRDCSVMITEGQLSFSDFSLLQKWEGLLTAYRLAGPNSYTEATERVSWIDPLSLKLFRFSFLRTCHFCSYRGDVKKSYGR